MQIGLMPDTRCRLASASGQHAECATDKVGTRAPGGNLLSPKARRICAWHLATMMNWVLQMSQTSVKPQSQKPSHRIGTQAPEAALTLWAAPPRLQEDADLTSHSASEDNG